MKASFSFGLICFLGTGLMAAESPKDQVLSAAAKLREQPNYAWKTTVTVPESAPFRPGPTEGKTDKTTGTYLKMSFGGNEIQAVLKGGKGATTNPEGDWRSLQELEESEGPARFMARVLRNFKTPGEQAAELAAAARDLKPEGDAFAGDLTEEGAKNLLSFGRRGAEAPAVRDAKGAVKFWLKDGNLVKYEFKVKGTREFNGNDVEIDRVTLVEIKDVGTTKVALPEGAKNKIS